MTSRIIINIEANSASDARDAMAQLLREHPAVAGSSKPLDFKDSVREPLVVDEAGFRGQPPVDNEHVADSATAFTEAEIAANGVKPTRERGKPSPGHARRTKAEIAEDEAAGSAPTIATMTTLPDDATSEQVADAFANIKGDISDNPESRVGPEDDAATQEADAADEAAETTAATAERVADGKPALTLDDIRTVLGNYQKAYGLPATMEDGPKVITEVCGEGKVKVSDVPQDKIADTIAALKKAGKDNRFERTPLVAA